MTEKETQLIIKRLAQIVDGQDSYGVLFGELFESMAKNLDKIANPLVITDGTGSYKTMDYVHGLEESVELHMEEKKALQAELKRVNLGPSNEQGRIDQRDELTRCLMISRDSLDTCQEELLKIRNRNGSLDERIHELKSLCQKYRNVLAEIESGISSKATFIIGDKSWNLEKTIIKFMEQTREEHPLP